MKGAKHAPKAREQALELVGLEPTTSWVRFNRPADYGCGAQRTDAATAAAASRAPSAASIHVTSVGCFCVATSFGSSANTSRS